MELAITLEDFPYIPRPFTFANWITFKTMFRTGVMPFAFQIRCAEALLRKRDVLCIAGTGTGKTLTFVIPCFVCPETIVWIVSPLNFIENQQCAQFLEWGLRAVSVNASTITPQLLEVSVACIHGFYT
jgi:superfamily II DNA helicase RecQ